MFFILVILLIMLILITILMFSKINIILKNIYLSTDKIKGRHIQENYQFIFELTLFKIKLLQLNITKSKLEKWNIKGKIKKQMINNKPKVDIYELKEIKDLPFEIKDLDLKIILGTENAALTAIMVGILSSIIGILLKNKIQNDKENKFKIIPIYINKNLLKVDVNCIISIKMIHIIYMLYILNKKRRDDKNVRTSNRRSYAYSYE